MAAVKPENILLRVGGRTLQRHGVLAVAGSRRGLVEVPITFARADATTCATYIDRDKILRRAAANVPRIEWVDLDGDGIRETPGILLEGSRVNGWTKSEKLDDAVWVKEFASVTANIGANFGGEGTGDLLVEDSTNNLHGFGRQPPTMTDNTQQSVMVGTSFFGTRQWIRIRTTDKGGTLRSTWFNVGAGTIGTTDAGHTNVKIEGPLGVLGAQGYRCSLSFNSASGGTTPIVQVYMATGDGGGAYQGDGTSGLVFHSLQFEADKAFRSSYVPTDASAVTRATDTLVLRPNPGPPAIGVEYTIDASFLPLWPRTGTMVDAPGIFTAGGQGTFAIDGKVAWDHYRNTSSAELVTRLTVNEDNSASSAVFDVPASGVIKTLTQLRATGSAHLVYGEALTDSASGATRTIDGRPWRLQELHIAARGNGTDPGYMVLLDLRLLRGRFSRAEVDALS